MVGRERWCAGRAELKWFFCVFFAFFCLVIFGLPEFFFANENSPVCHQFSPRPKIPLVFSAIFFCLLGQQTAYFYATRKLCPDGGQSSPAEHVQPRGSSERILHQFAFLSFFAFFCRFFRGPSPVCARNCPSEVHLGSLCQHPISYRQGALPCRPFCPPHKVLYTMWRHTGVTWEC